MYSELKYKETDYGLRFRLKHNVVSLSIEFIENEIRPLFIKMEKKFPDGWAILLDMKDLESMANGALKAIRHAHLMAMRYGVVNGAIIFSESFDKDLIQKLFPDTKGGFVIFFLSKRKIQIWPKQQSLKQLLG